MKIRAVRILAVFVAVIAYSMRSDATPPGKYRFVLNGGMICSETGNIDFSGILDEQYDAGDPPSGEPVTGWKRVPGKKAVFPASVVLNLGGMVPVGSLWFYDTNGTGEVKIETGGPKDWKEAAVYGCGKYKSWAEVPVDTETGFLRLTLLSGGANFSEVVLDAYSEKGWAEETALRAEEARKAREKEEAVRRAREEALKRPVSVIEPFGRLSLVEEVNLAGMPDGELRISPSGASSVETILGRKARVLNAVPGEASVMTVRLGKMKMLRPGAAYVLEVEYPEDAPRSIIVINRGNETMRGFHTGLALGDALHTKYVNSRPESLDLPLSGKWESWRLLFRLHDRFQDGGSGVVSEERHRERIFKPEDGFDVTIAQFEKGNDPLSKGAAVGCIRLYEVVDEKSLPVKVPALPSGLPKRRIFWREEMADGVIQGSDPQKWGVSDPLDWYRYKAELMKFLGINTYSKDLLEFGACQHWDSSQYGGDKWVYYDRTHAGLWARIVTMMGQYGFDILPYYEYSGSKGKEGLGPQRRAKPLTRDDAFSHIKWIESSNADITDPETYDDFKKMLDLTVVKFLDKAVFAGIWIRPRAQLPVGFGPGALKRFGAEANGGKVPSREDLRGDKALYSRYIDWWHQKRREFLTAMRDYLREKGVNDAVVLFTGDSSEPGKGFGSWEDIFVTDRPDLWRGEFGASEDGNKQTEVITPEEVAKRGLYKRGLLSPGLNWGGWELNHSNPADDPQNYKDTEGVMLSHGFNRLYTVSDPSTMDLYRARSGLFMVRHYCLNENMIYDADDKGKTGYFVCDFERAGPFCMQAEAIAVANGDPVMIGYLCGGNFGRGFPEYVRRFNANFLALPALPSEIDRGASSDEGVVVRKIDAGSGGLYFAVVNTTASAKRGVKISTGTAGILYSPTGEEVAATGGGHAVMDLYPYQLVTLWVKDK